MGFFVLGVNHKECPIEIREKLHFGAKELTAAFEESKAAREIQELLILSTCNRVEFYGFTEEPALVEPAIVRLIQKIRDVERSVYSCFLYRYEGKDAVHHLFRVAAGLDSLVVGENEILGQLREAFRAANQSGTLHSLLYRLVEKSLKAGKDVRTRTKINEGAVSIPSVAVELAEKIFGDLAGKKVMVLGTGDMSTLTLKNLRDSGADILFVVSRNEERGRELAAEFMTQWVPFEGWEKKLGHVDILIASTAAPHPVVHEDAVKQAMALRRNRPLFLIDIALPRDIEPQVNTLENVYLYNLDDLKGVAQANLGLRRREIRAAEVLVEKEVIDFQSWLEQLAARPTLERFEEFLDEVLEKELARFGRTTGLGPSDKEELRTRIRAKLLHPPLEKIKEASKNGGVKRYLEALQSLFDLDK